VPFTNDLADVPFAIGKRHKASHAIGSRSGMDRIPERGFAILLPAPASL
jgi:hypothetical protein